MTIILYVVFTFFGALSGVIDDVRVNKNVLVMPKKIETGYHLGFIQPLCTSAIASCLLMTFYAVFAANQDPRIFLMVAIVGGIGSYRVIKYVAGTQGITLADDRIKSVSAANEEEEKDL